MARLVLSVIIISIVVRLSYFHAIAFLRCSMSLSRRPSSHHSTNRILLILFYHVLFILYNTLSSPSQLSAFLVSNPHLLPNSPKHSRTLPSLPFPSALLPVICPSHRLLQIPSISNPFLFVLNIHLTTACYPTTAFVMHTPFLSFSSS